MFIKIYFKNMEKDTTSGSVSCLVSPVSFPIPAASNKASSLAWVSGSTGWMSAGNAVEVLLPLELNLEGRVVISDETEPIRVVLTPFPIFSRVVATLILEASAAVSVERLAQRWAMWCGWDGWFSGSLPSPATRYSSGGKLSAELSRFSKMHDF